MRRLHLAPLLLACLLAPRLGAQTPFGTAFTYQGRLTEMGGPASGTYDIRFTLFDAPAGGSQIGVVTQNGVAVSSGLFTASLDYGSLAFNGSARWLELAVQKMGGGFTTLSPRQPITATPYAVTIFARTVVVKPVGTAAQNGSVLVNALNGITTASATNPWLLKIEPGVYSVPAGALQMKPYVDVEGSGEAVTRVTSIGTADNATGTILTASNAELRLVTVENTGGPAYAKAVYVNATSPTLSHVTALASGATAENQGIFLTGPNTAVIQDVTIRLTGSGSANSYGYLGLFGGTAALARVRSILSGGNFATAFYQYQGYGTMENLSGFVDQATISAGFTNVMSSFALVSNSKFQAVGGTSYGVQNLSGSNVNFFNVTAFANGSTISYAVNNDSSEAYLSGANLSASGAPSGSNIGFENVASGITILQSNLYGDIGIRNTAVSGTYDVRVDNSVVAGTTRTISSTPQFNLFVGGSKLEGPIPSGGTQVCVSSWKATYVALTAGCN